MFRSVKFVDHTVIADPQSILDAARKALVRIIVEPGPKLMNFAFDRFANVRRQLEKDGVELACVNFGCATHACSGSQTRMLSSAMSFFPRSMLAANSSLTSS